jgi:hypothetical protein
MAFNSAYLSGPLNLGSLGQGKLFIYDTADTQGTITGTGHFAEMGAGASPATSRGMEKGDLVLVRYYDVLTTKANFYGSEIMEVTAIDSDGDVTVSMSGTVAVTPTADGTGTGQIPPGAKIVIAASSGNADHIVTLPPPVVGKEILIFKAAATVFEMRTNAPATVGISGGTGATAEAATLVNSVMIRLTCVSATNWVGIGHVAASTATAIEAAA